MKLEEMAESAADLEATADLAAATFYDNAVKYGVAKYPRTNLRKSRNWAKFKRIARNCMLHGTDVAEFVEKAFKSVLERHSIVTVQDIVSYDMQEEEKRSPEDGLQSSASPQDGLQSSASPQDAWNLLSCRLLDTVFSLDSGVDKIDLLDNPMYCFPAWFRVFSPRDPVSKILVHWGDLANEELCENLKLEEFLKAKRPKTHKLLKSVMQII